MKSVNCLVPENHLRGLELISEGYYDEAIVYFENKVKEEPENYEIWFYLGNAYFENRDYGKAIKAYERVLSLNSSFQSAYISLASAYLKIGKKRKAKRIILDGLKKFNNYEFLYLSSIVLAECGYYKNAEKIIKGLIEKSREDSYLVVLGNIYFGMEKYEEALKAYQEAIEINEKNEEAWNNMGFLYFSLGNYVKARECYEKAIETDQGYREAWYNLGYLEHTLGNLSKAVFYYWKALQIDSRDEVTWNNLGNALYNLGKYMESIPYFMKSVSINPEYEIGWNNIGNALDKMGMHKYSIPFHERALKINPKFDYAWHAKGHALSALGHYEEALDALENAIELNSEYADTWYWRGYSLYKLERYEEAIDSLKTAVKIEPNVRSFELIGDIYSFLGYYVESLRYYEEALKYGNSEEKARIYIKMGRYEEALEFVDNLTKANILYKLGRYNEILKIEGNGQDLDYIRCLALEALGRYEEALKIASKYRTERFRRERKFIEFLINGSKFSLDTNDRDYILRIGTALLDKGEYDKAIEIFRDIKTKEGYYFLGEAYIALGKVKEGIRYLEIAAGIGLELALERLEEVKMSEKVPS